RNTTLQLMLNHGYITEEEYNLAKNSDLTFALNYVKKDTYNPNQPYIDQVIEECIKLTGQDPTIIPMDIYTALNVETQKEVDKVMNGEVIPYPNDLFDVGIGVTKVDTGEIVAVGAGRNYHTETVKHDLSMTTRQPGSAMKPLLAYSSAFDLLGWSTKHTVNDKADDYFHAGRNLNNSDGQYEGNISLAYALGVSKNTTAAATMIELVKQTGRNYWVDFCKKLGFDQSVCDNFAEQYCIGGADMFASPIQMSSAYNIFANKGIRINAHRIRRVLRRTDQEEISGDATEYELISEQAAFMMSDLLRQVVEGGYNNFNNLLASNYPVYAKSGTSDWGTEGPQYGIPAFTIKDEWSVGYTSQYSIAIWSGYTPEAFTQGWYITDYVLNQATAFKMNHHLLDFLAGMSEPTAIARPDKISDYNGGYIKTEFAAKGDPSSSSSSSNSSTKKDENSSQNTDTNEAAKKACINSGG
ncbi:MAG: hypothetical protein HUJ54_14580, partial [Erysipelotrichaceae bacterium]|nr:hypothetical protein [Erysipelotrichaceae bacterium]